MAKLRIAGLRSLWLLDLFFKVDAPLTFVHHEWSGGSFVCERVIG